MSQQAHLDHQDTLRHDLRAARARVDRLVAELRAVEEAQQALETDRRKFDLLRTAANALDELDSLGAASLFWGERTNGSGALDALRLARSGIDGFEKQLALVDEQRHGILDELEHEQVSVDGYSSSLYEIERLEEERRLEWLIERDVENVPIRASLMPWASAGDGDTLYRKALAASFAISAFATLVFAFVELPPPSAWKIHEGPEPLTGTLIPDALPPAEVMLVPTPTKTPEPAFADATKSGAVVYDDTVGPAAEQGDDASGSESAGTLGGTGSGSGSRRGGGRGLMAFREKFTALASNQPVERLGTAATIDDPSGIPDEPAVRSMVTAEGPGDSGGIQLAALSRGTGGSGKALTGLAIERATSAFGTGTGVGGRGNGDPNSTGIGDGSGSGTGRGYGDGSGDGTGTGFSGGRGRGNGAGRAGSSVLHARTDEEIQIVFDRHKAVLYRLYNRELRENPTLKGQMVLRLTILPDGRVSLCEIKSTNMRAPQLADEVVARVRGFDFGAKSDIPAVTIVYPIDFLPAT